MQEINFHSLIGSQKSNAVPLYLLVIPNNNTSSLNLNGDNMYKTNKSLKFLVICFWLFVSTHLVSPVSAVDLPFDPNDYNFIVYDSGTQDSCIRYAMKNMLGRDLTSNEIRTSAQGNHVTLNDLQTPNTILIVGTNFSGDISGLDSNILETGITGRVILTGHDADYHYYHTTFQGHETAITFFINAINYILQGNGTGMIAFACSDDYPYLPSYWGISPTFINPYVGGVNITDFTSQSTASHIYDDLLPANLSYIGSYHNKFTINSGSEFVPFEVNETEIATIALTSLSTPPE
jgi:hypothetical protein